jgi:hypothetical protein
MLSRFELHYTLSTGGEFIKSRDIYAHDLLEASKTAGLRADTVGKWSERQAYGYIGRLFCTVGPGSRRSIRRWIPGTPRSASIGGQLRE